MAPIGTYKDPQTRSCFVQCTACYRCDRRREGSGEDCRNCSGRADPLGFVDEHPSDYCECRLGKLRWRHKSGQVIIRNLTSNPFKGEVDFVAESQDEVDWRAYVNEEREKRGDVQWNPIRVTES